MIVWLLLNLAWAREHRDHLEQARLFAQREWYVDAESELLRAIGDPDGAIDPEAWYLLAMVRRQLADHEGARHAADRALLHARTPHESETAAALLSWLDTRFGTLRLAGEHPTRIRLELDGGLFDPELEHWYRRVAVRAKRLHALPADLDLPVGHYVVNGTAVEITPGGQHTVEVKPSARERVQIDLRTGVSTLFGPAMGHRLPSPTVGLGVWTGLWGPLVAGVQGDVGLQVWQAPSSALYTAPASWSAGVRLGLDAWSADPFVLRPSLGWRVAGIGPLPCEAATPCSVDGAPALGTAHLPFGELALRTTARRGLGGGVRLGFEMARGSTAVNGGAPTRVGGHWSAFGLVVGIDLSYAP